MAYKYDRTQETSLNRPYFLATALLLSTAAIAQTAPTLTIDLAQPKANVSPQLYGLMTEEINYSYDGGLYAELVRNRTFQDRGKIPPSWFLYEEAMPKHRWPSIAPPAQRSPAAEPAIDGQDREPPRSGGHQQPGILGLSCQAANHLSRFVLCQGERSFDRAGNRKPGRG